MSEKENIREIILIGRDRDCNFICNDTSVSRHHAQIIDYGTSCSVVDLGSTNGTFVNGRRVSSETTLHKGDGLRVGNADIPWQQLVQPPQEPKNNKRVLWVLIPIIAALLVGGGLAIYFIYGNSKNKDKIRKEENWELVGELAKQITEKEEQAVEAQKNIESVNNAAKKTIDSLNRITTEAEIRAAERQQEANRIESEANLRIGEANEKITEANEKLNEANEKLNEAEEKQTEADEKLDNANKKLDTVNKKLDTVRQVLEESESIRREDVINAIEEMEEEDVKAICRELKIEFNVRLAAKEALKKEFITSGDVRRQEIGRALRAKQKLSN